MELPVSSIIKEQIIHRDFKLDSPFWTEFPGLSINKLIFKEPKKVLVFFSISCKRKISLDEESQKKNLFVQLTMNEVPQVTLMQNTNGFVTITGSAVLCVPKNEAIDIAVKYRTDSVCESDGMTLGQKASLVAVAFNTNE